MRRARWIANGNILSALIAVCAGLTLFLGSAIQAAGADEYEHLKIGMPRKIASIDPLGYPRLDRPELNVQMCFFDHLFRRNKKGDVIGHLAREYKWIDTNTFRVFLRQGVKFHNGDEFTAADVKWSIEDMINPDRGPGLVSVLKNITEIRVVDKYTVDFITDAPIPTLPSKLTTYPLMVSSKERSAKSAEEYENQPMGTGPFKFVEWKKGKHIIAVRNDDYFLGVPKIKKVTFYPIPDHNTRVSALKSGDIDIATDLKPSLANELAKTPGFEITATPSARVEWVWIRTDVKPFDDKRFRQALNYAVNKEEFVQTIMEGYGMPVGQPCPPYFSGHNPDIGVYPYNPEKARQLLAEIGLPENFQIHYQALSIDDERVRAIAGYLEAVGLKVKLEIKEAGAAYADFLERKARPLFHMNWSNWSLLDIEGTLADVFGCNDKEKGIGRWSYYCNPRIEQIIQELKTIDEEKRLSLAHEASRILHEDAAAIWLFAHSDIHGKRAGIPEFKARMDNTIRLKWIKGGGEY